MHAVHSVSDDISWGAGVFPAVAPMPDAEVLVSGFFHNPVLDNISRDTVLEQARQIASVARDAGSLFSAEKIMALYKLSTAEGRMIMEMAEALLRVPDAATRDFLIFDKLASGHWLDADATGFVRGMETALELASGIVRRQREKGLKAMVSKLGVPAVRRAIETAMRQMGGQFVFAETIEAAVTHLNDTDMLYSFDMLGEAARSADDCDRYFAAYAHAIACAGAKAKADDVNHNSGVSVKLSALSCRLQTRYWPASCDALTDRVVQLALAARRHNIPLTIDAEEYGRLQPSLYVFERLLAHPQLRGWSGMGIVVQAYARHAGAVIDWLAQQAQHHAVRIPVRLVKGAYWDTEIKIAQEKGLADFPVYTSKNHTDLAYLAHAKRLMTASQHFLPQFASHNAYTLAAVTHLAHSIKPASYELQKLHGMGDAVHNELRNISSAPLRIYAPVGCHQDLLAYLVRRILENGASSSFMNKLADVQVGIEDLVTDPYNKIDNATASLATGAQMFAPLRKNSRGFDEEDVESVRGFAKAIASPDMPSRPDEANHEDVAIAFAQADKASWQQLPASKRADIVDRIADNYEQAAGRLYHLLVHEAGKTIDDAVGEVREAVDFCRYYAVQTRQLGANSRARGTVVAISPWNFPLAIFTGQVVAALAAGNAVLAKPAAQTPRIAALAISLMYQAGVPDDALHLLCGGGAVGDMLTKAGQADMVVFTGSTVTAKIIEGAIAQSVKPHAPLIAETGGLNAMIVDASALLERAVDDILTSAFRSAGQRCSALRILYIQDDIAADLISMIRAAAAMLKVGDAADMDTDIGPIIDQDAKMRIDQHVAAARHDGRLIWQGTAPASGCFCAPSIIKLAGIESLESEIFGPVLHVATYKAGDEAKVVEAINKSGYGLTFAIHSRIDANIKAVSDMINVGNVYINRNQIGAVVGAQPFGGHGLSGTGPKAGGVAYLRAFTMESEMGHGGDAMLSRVLLPGPSGERNSYSVMPRHAAVLVCHPDAQTRARLSQIARDYGNKVQEAVVIPDSGDFDVVMTLADHHVDLAVLRKALHCSRRRVIPFITDQGGHVWLQQEKHICRDMTASGGNIDLLMR